jgi:hypothetical protein
VVRRDGASLRRPVQRARWRVRASLSSALALAIGLAGCGGSNSGEAGAVAAAIKRASATRNPADCARLETQRFLDQTELANGKAALQSCRDDARDGSGNPRSTKVSNVTVTGGTAHARAAFEGGNLDGQALNLRLVKQGGGWKLDHMDSFASFDRTRFLHATRSSLQRPPQALPEAAVGCIVGRFSALSDGELQAVFLQSDPGRLASLTGPCFVSLLKRELAAQGVPKTVTDCVVARIDKPPYDAIRRLLLGADAARLLGPIAKDCVREGLAPGASST